jgi:hypothetical protein
MMMLGLFATAQVERDGLPVSWNLEGQLDHITTFVDLPSIDESALLAEDEEAGELKEIPFRFAYKHSVSLNTVNSGRWSTLNNGDRIWMLGIQADDALGLSVVFDDFYLPPGSILYLYSADRTQVIGGLTSDNNKNSGILASSILSSSDMIIEYYEPLSALNEGRLSLRSISQVYKPFDPAVLEALPNRSCMENASCYAEDPTQSSTVLITVDDGTRWATGTLVNNANFDGKPYILTGSQNLWGDPASWLFTFNYASDQCSPSMVSSKILSISGAVTKAIVEDEKIALLELSKRPPTAWNVYYAGWDISGATPQTVTTYHHPSGDVVKTSHSSAPTPDEFKGVNTWRINGWDSGTTMSGSTGAPLFNDQQKVIGVMFSGLSSCSTTGADYYAMLHRAWTGLQKYLNPHNLPIVSISGMYPGFTTVADEVFKEDVAFFPNPSSSEIRILNESDEAVTRVDIYTSSGQLATSTTFFGAPIQLVDLPSGLYLLDIVLETRSVQRRLIKL